MVTDAVIFVPRAWRPAQSIENTEHCIEHPRLRQTPLFPTVVSTTSHQHPPTAKLNQAVRQKHFAFNDIRIAASHFSQTTDLPSEFHEIQSVFERY